MLQISCLGTYSEIRLPMSNRFLKLMAEDIAKERMRVKHHIHIQLQHHHNYVYQRLGATGLLRLLFMIGMIGTSSGGFLVITILHR